MCTQRAATPSPYRGRCKNYIITSRRATGGATKYYTSAASGVSGGGTALTETSYKTYTLDTYI